MGTSIKINKMMVSHFPSFFFFLHYAVVLDTPLDYSLDDCIEYIQEDELVEVTPSSIRMCKNPKFAAAKKSR